ncbi:MAG: MBL fold metallo-hydrolase [Erysipelotrichaceae bacterium]|jgi:phosphoribosyl 1,2-cyclic phosphodiesterase|nr:MBL fold metallo-hydrolase [Erysipelotrichaceae bacterium]
MFYNIIASGSKGNATLVGFNNTLILIDMGITLTKLKEGLLEVNKTIEDIDAVIFTHDHSDHTSGLRFLPQGKMYALEGTLKGEKTNIAKLDEPFEVKDFIITPFKTSHDAINPCGYIIESEKEKLVYVTDTGYILNDTLSLIKNPNYLIIESNHDIKMLLKTNRPIELKQRIMSEHGHLCNEDSAIATLEIIGPKTKEVVLAHLSEEANTPEQAVEAYHKIFAHFNKKIDKIILKTASQWHSLKGGHFEN